MEVKPGYKQTEVGVIPEDWETQTGEQLTTLIGKGGSPRWQGFEYSNHGMLFVTSENVRDGFLDIREPKYLPLAFHEKLERTKLQTHDILINLVGASIGRSCQILQDIGEANVNQAVAVFRVKREVSSNFVACCFQAPTTIERILDMQVDAARPNISLGDLRRFRIPLPPLPEQRAIAAALSDVDALLGGLERLIAKKRDLKQAAMQQLLTGQTRLPGFSGEWRDSTLGQVISRFSTGLNPRQNFRLNSGGTLFYVTIKNFSRGCLLLDENCDLIDEAAFRLINERSDLRKDDILFASIGRIGDAYLINETPNNWNINESVFTLRPDQEQVVPLMLFYLLTTKEVEDALKQGVTGSTFTSIKQADLKRIRCRLPVELEEQTAIAAVLSDMDAELAALGARRDKTLDLKQAMMQELLTGRTRLVKPEVAHA